MVCIWCFGCYFAVLWEFQGGRSLGLEEDAAKCFKPIIRSGIGLPSWLTPVELCTALKQVCFARWKENSRVQQSKGVFPYSFWCPESPLPLAPPRVGVEDHQCITMPLAGTYIRGWRLPSWIPLSIQEVLTVQGTLTLISREILI